MIPNGNSWAFSLQSEEPLSLERFGPKIPGQVKTAVLPAPTFASGARRAGELKLLAAQSRNTNPFLQSIY